jgi:hypothetical protein
VVLWKGPNLNNITAKKDRYLRDSLPIRLGGLAANLARVSSFVNDERNRDAVNGLLEESKHFIEWTAPDADIQISARLAALQIRLAVWQRGWTVNWNNESIRQEIGKQAKTMSDEVLIDSGLLNGR